jgi:hypothetical protein
MQVNVRRFPYERIRESQLWPVSLSIPGLGIIEYVYWRIYFKIIPQILHYSKFSKFYYSFTAIFSELGHVYWLEQMYNFTILRPERCRLLAVTLFRATREQNCLKSGNCNFLWEMCNNSYLGCSYNKTNCMHQFLIFIFAIKLYMFRTVSLSIIRSFSLYTQQWYFLQVCWQLASRVRIELRISILILLASCHQTCMIYTIAVCTVKNSWWWTEELPETFRVLFQK